MGCWFQDIQLALGWQIPLFTGLFFLAGVALAHYQGAMEI